VKSQVLFAHVATPFNGAVHAFPHEPQLLGFVAVSTHSEPQFAWPGMQFETQAGEVPAPLAHSGALDGHTVVQLPQCCGPTSVHTPSQMI
jgi:hypothetical protein